MAKVEEFLEHYGVKGMKWGVRRSQAELDRAAGRTPTRRSQAAKAKGMSEAELRSRINRIQMEQQYVNLTSSPSTVSKGAKLVLSVLGQGAKNIAISQISRRGGRGVDNLIASILNKK